MLLPGVQQHAGAAQIRIRDDVRLPASEYVIRLRGSEVARGEIMPRHLLALDTGAVIDVVDGLETTDPSFGMPARWIAPTRRSDAEAMGYVVVESTTMIATHLMETLKSNAAELLGRSSRTSPVDSAAFEKRSASMGPPRRLVVTEPRISARTASSQALATAVADSLRRVLTVDDESGLKAIEADAAKAQYRIKDIVRAVANSELLRKR